MARNGFDKTRVFRRVAQGFAQSADRVIQTVFELDERFLGPEPFLKLLSGDDFPGMLEESEQNLQRFFVQFDSDALLAQLPCRRIHFERAETHRGLWRGSRHAWPVLDCF